MFGIQRTMSPNLWWMLKTKQTRTRTQHNTHVHSTQHNTQQTCTQHTANFTNNTQHTTHNTQHTTQNALHTNTQIHTQYLNPKYARNEIKSKPTHFTHIHARSHSHLNSTQLNTHTLHWIFQLKSFSTQMFTHPLWNWIYHSSLFLSKITRIRIKNDNDQKLARTRLSGSKRKKGIKQWKGLFFLFLQYSKRGRMMERSNCTLIGRCVSCFFFVAKAKRNEKHSTVAQKRWTKQDTD